MFKRIYDLCKLRIARLLTLTAMALTLWTGATSAATVTYVLDNVVLDDGEQMTGLFDWTYAEGDFENGSGVFTELFIPHYGSDIDALTITFDVTNSIEFSLTGNINNEGVDITLFLANAYSPTTAAVMDLARSKYDFEIGALSGGFLSGSVAPVVPIPAAAWLFGSGLIGLFTLARRRKAVF